ncbi:MAG: hypothetical protein U1F06_00400 [Steroidobacteraceae bacterium]
MSWTSLVDARARPPGKPRGGWRPGSQAISGQLPDAIEIAAGELGRGAGLLPALRYMAEHARPPLLTALAPLRDVERIGAPLERSLRALQERSGCAELALLAHTVAIAAQAASPPRALLLRLARRLRRRHAAERRRAALLRAARRRAWLLAALPAVVPGALLLVRRALPGA